MQMVLSVVVSARGHEHDVLLLTGDEGPEGMRRMARSALVDGFVLMDVSSTTSASACCGSWACQAC